MAFAGLRGTDNWGTDERPKNFREGILWANPAGMSPLFALTSKMGKSQSVDDPEFSWFEEDKDIVRLSINGGIAAGILTVVVDAAGATGTRGDGNFLKAGDRLMYEDPTQPAGWGDVEIATVTGVTSATSVQITRGSAGTTAKAWVDGAFLTLIGNAFEEGSDAPTVASRNPTKLYNYTQIWKTAFGVTGTADSTKTRTGDGFTNDKERKTFDHSMAIEESLLFGVPSEVTGAGGYPLRSTGGIRHFLTTNATIEGGSATLAEYLDFYEQLFHFNVDGTGTERLVLCGQGYLNQLNTAIEGGAPGGANSKFRYEGKMDVWGMNLTRIETSFGTLGLKTHPLMNRHPVYRNSAFVISPAGIKWRPLKGRDTHIVKNVQGNGEDTRKDQFLTEGGLEIHHEKTMGYHGGVV